jgi:hypothetical protein
MHKWQATIKSVLLGSLRFRTPQASKDVSTSLQALTSDVHMVTRTCLIAANIPTVDTWLLVVCMVNNLYEVMTDEFPLHKKIVKLSRGGRVSL